MPGGLLNGGITPEFLLPPVESAEMRWNAGKPTEQPAEGRNVSPLMYLPPRREEGVSTLLQKDPELQG